MRDVEAYAVATLLDAAEDSVEVELAEALAALEPDVVLDDEPDDDAAFEDEPELAEAVEPEAAAAVESLPILLTDRKSVV